MNELTFVTAISNASLGQFEIRRGWNEWVMEQLVVRSQESAMKRWVPRDYSERFASIERAKEWGERDEHVVYSLIFGDELTGILWFTKYDSPQVEDAEYTFAIRMYNRVRGHKLSVPFAVAALDDLAETTGYRGKIWLETNMNNESAVKLYQKLGFVEKEIRGDRAVFIRPSK